MPDYDKKIALSSFDEIILTFSDCTFTSFSVFSTVGDKMSSEGQAFSGCHNHSGSFHQAYGSTNQLLIILLKHNPLDCLLLEHISNYWLE